MSMVLVTGGAGFISEHCIVQLLAAGHTVRATLRSLGREAEVRAALKEGGCDAGDRLSFTVADLEKDAGWAEAARGCEYVLHVASPFPLRLPKNEDLVIVPAREGALRVLKASRDAGVKRVVLTSSFAAIGYGRPPQTQAFDEKSWTDPNGGDVSTYVKSKALAERAAWDFMEKEGGSLQLSVVNPVGVFGPVLAHDLSTSVVIVKRMLDGELPGAPKLRFGVVDVRDVADLHLRAMTHPDAAGERFLATAGDHMTILEMAMALRERLGPLARRVPRFELPNWVLHLVALADPAVTQILPELGKNKNSTSEKAKRVLGWQPRSREDALVASAESLARLRILKRARKMAA
jgi:nucleoside-diphosphate-sugar epimerase